MITLSWISNEANKWNTFVANRWQKYIASHKRIHGITLDLKGIPLSRGINSEKIELMKLW